MSLLLLSLSSQVLLDPQLLLLSLPTFLEAWKTATDVFTQNKNPISMTFWASRGKKAPVFLIFGLETGGE